MMQPCLQYPRQTNCVVRSEYFTIRQLSLVEVDLDKHDERPLLSKNKEDSLYVSNLIQVTINSIQNQSTLSSLTLKLPSG